MKVILFKKSWNFFYFNAVGRLVKRACLSYISFANFYIHKNLEKHFLSYGKMWLMLYFPLSIKLQIFFRLTKFYFVITIMIHFCYMADCRETTFFNYWDDQEVPSLTQNPDSVEWIGDCYQRNVDFTLFKPPWNSLLKTLNKLLYSA